MSRVSHYAIPLFALVDRSKVDTARPLPDELGDHLAAYLQGGFGIESLSAQLIQLDGGFYLVLHEVPDTSLAPLCALVDVQRTQLYRYARSDQAAVTLTPLNVRV
jgi:hypothetical protein